MIVLWILLILMCIILLILLMPITLRFKYNGEAYLSISYFFIKYKILPQSEAAKKKKDKKQKEKSEKTGDTKESEPTFLEKVVGDFKKNNDFSDKLKIIFEALKKILKRVKQLLKFLKITKFNLSVKIGSPDAADTALNYGRFNALFYTVLGFVTPLFRWGKRRVSIDPDFTCEKSSATFEISVRGSLMPFIIIALLLYKDCKKLYSEL